MNFLDILKSIEQAVYEIAMWVILIPKTLYKIFTQPSSIQEYIRTELAKEEKKQFTDYMSPVILWLLLVIIPAYMLINYFISQDVKDFVGNRHQNYLFYITSVLTGFLLCPALIICLFDKTKIDKQSFKEPFYVQCYVQAPFSFLVGSSLAVMRYYGYNFEATDHDDYTFLFNSANGLKDLMVLPLFALLGYFALVEVKIIMQTGKSVGKSILILFICLFMSAFIMFATAGIGYVLFFGM